MKKLICIAVLSLALLLPSCGSTQKEVDIDVMAGKLAAEVLFDDEVTAVEDSMAGMVYPDVEFEDVALYIGSGATAEEIAAFVFPDTEKAEKGMELAEIHIEDQIAAYESYMPDEVARLEDAVIRQSGKYLVVVVSADAAKAEQVVDEYLN